MSGLVGVVGRVIIKTFFDLFFILLYINKPMVLIPAMTPKLSKVIR